MLDHEETMHLIDLAKDGDEQAKESLLKHNTPLIKSIVNRYKNKSVEYEDLMQLGSIGLLKAVQNFDKKFNVKFSTYAVPMIAGEIKRFMRDDGSIKVSRALKTLNTQINEYIEGCKAVGEAEPTIEEIAEKFKIEQQEVVLALDSSKYPLSIYESMDDESGVELQNRIASKETTDDMIDKIVLKDVIMSLPERERKIIILRYFRDKTQSELAGVFGISQVQISRIESKVLKLLRNSLNANAD